MGSQPDARRRRDEANLLANVDQCLAQGVEIMKWWIEKDRTRDFAQVFELTRVFNRPDEGYSFFDTVPMPSGPLPVMGDVPGLFYDMPKARKGANLWQWCREVEVYALRYFMRISDFRLPQTVTDEDQTDLPEFLRFLSWCFRGSVSREGFGFKQLYYKRRDDGRIGAFPLARRFAIVDQRELGRTWEWVVANVRIFNFALSFPVDPDLPKLSFPLVEDQYIIYSDAFVSVEPDPPEPELLGRFTFGYAMLKPRYDDSVLAYGPGQFDAGFQLFIFKVFRDGTIRVRMPFVVNRPTKILDLSLDPLDWGLKTLELLTFGRASGFVEPLQYALQSLPLRPGGFDPVFTSIELLNLVTLGQASRRLCISKEQLEKFFLVFHFDQYYTMATGSLLTWRQIPDWLATERLPAWVRTGVSS